MDLARGRQSRAARLEIYTQEKTQTEDLMTISILPVVAAVIGCLLYAFSPNAKAAEIGRLLFFAGALAALLTGAHSISIH